MSRYTSFGHSFVPIVPRVAPVSIAGASVLGGFRSAALIRERNKVAAASLLGGLRSSAIIQLGSTVVMSGASQLGGLTSAATVAGSYASPITLGANHVYWPRTVADVTLASASLTTADQSDFSSAGWTKTNIGTITVDNTTDPDGGTAADLITDTATNATHQLAHTITNAGTHVMELSAYGKANTLSWLYLQGNSSTTTRAWFNVSTGAVGTVGVNVISATVTPVANGFFLCKITFLYASGSHVIGLASADNTSTYVGTGKTLWLYKANVNQDRIGTSADINGGTAKDATQAMVNNQLLWVPSSANANNKPALRGINGSKDLVAGAATDWGFLTNGAGGSLMVVTYHPSTASVANVVSTNNYSQTARGLQLIFNGTTSVDLYVGNDTISILHLSAAMDPTGVHTYIYTYSTAAGGSLYVDGALAASGAQAGTPSSAALTAFRIGNTVNAANDDFCSVATWNSVLSSGSALRAHAWAVHEFGSN